MTAKSSKQIPNPFKDPLVRRALALAVDRGILILAGYGTAAAQVFPTGLPARRRNCSRRSRTTTRQRRFWPRPASLMASILSSPDPLVAIPATPKAFRLSHKAGPELARDRPAGSSTLLGVQHETGGRRLCRLVRRHLRRGGRLHSARASGVAAHCFGKRRELASCGKRRLEAVLSPRVCVEL